MQGYRAIQSLPCHHRCKRAKTVPPSTKLRQLSHLKIWLMGNPRKRKGTSIHFTPVAYQEGLPQGSRESWESSRGIEPVASLPWQVFPLPPHTSQMVRRRTERCTSVQRPLGVTFGDLSSLPTECGHGLTDSWPTMHLALYHNKNQTEWVKETRHERAQTVRSIYMKFKNRLNSPIMIVGSTTVTSGQVLTGSGHKGAF